VPAEAHRLQHRVTGRDRRAIVIMLTLSVLTAGILIAVSAVSRYHDGQSGCLRFEQAGVMGGGTWRLCGDDASRYCVRHAGESRAVDARCEELAKRT
jgi:hypothetical protein